MKVFVTRKIPEIAIQILKEAGCEISQHLDSTPLTQAALISKCQQADALFCSGHHLIDAHFLNACRHLKIISLMSVGFDHVDISLATKFKIPVGNTPGVLSQATADLALMLLLAVSRNAFYVNQNIREGRWGYLEENLVFGQELYGKTLGIYGLGKIGFELAKKCQVLYQMKIIYHNRNRNLLAEEAFGATYVSFDSLLENSDVISIHPTLSPETRGKFNQYAFEKMKPSAIFINTGRGGLHNELDLIEALQKGKIWGAGLDVSDPEPMNKDNPLLYMSNVCVVPHIGSATVETRGAMARLAAENIIALMRGEKLPHIVNSEVYSMNDEY